MNATETYRVLLIENNKADAQLILKALQEADIVQFQTEHVDHLSAGLEKLKQSHFGIVLLALSLPDSQGLDTFRTLHAKHPAVPTLILSSLENDRMALEAVHLGAQDYLVKKFIHAKMIQRVIRYAIERKKLDQLKDDFVNTVSHEFRTPLSIVKGALENLEDGVGGNLTKKQEKSVDMARRNIERLSRLISDLLDLSRLESGRAKMNLQVVDAKTLLEQVVENFRVPAEENKIKLLAEIPKNLPAICVDLDMLEQVLTNLISNALRFARKQAILRVKEVPSQGVQFSVTDDGPGINPEEQKRLFGKFEQLHRPQGGAGYKGTGLGLVICKRIIDHHGGKIWVESTAGQGATFSFLVP